MNKGFGIRAEYASGCSIRNSSFHKRSKYEICLLLDKNADYYIGDSCYHMSRGCLVIIAPEEIRMIDDRDNMDFSRICIYFDRADAELIGEYGVRLLSCFENRDSGKNNMLRLSEVQTEEFMRLSDQIINCTMSTSAEGEVMAFSFFLQLLVFIDGIYYKRTTVLPGVSAARIRPIIKYIDENLCSDLSVNKIAEALSMSRSNICKIFKEDTDMSIHSYVTKRRIDYAKQLMRHGQNVTEACFMSGFNDYTSFIRSFKRVAGCPPGVYRNSRIIK